MLGLGLINKPKTDIGAYLRVVTDDLKLYMPYKDKGGVIDFVGEGSCNFDGGDYILCGDDTSLDITDDITMMAWVKPASAGQNAHIIGRDDGSNRNYVLYVNGNIYSFDYFVSDSAQRVSSTTADTANVWVHLACTRHKATGKNIIYVNGVAEDSDADSTAAIDNDDVQFSIGCRDNATSDFTGNIKNVALWNRALTATEVQNVMYKTYAEVSGRLASGLVSWWALDVDYTDYKGSNDGTNSGSTLDTDLYGGDTPVIPRALDNAPTVQADAIGSGSALFVASNTDYITIADDSTLDITGDFSITMWAKFNTLPSSGTGQAMLQKGTQSNPNRAYGMAMFNTSGTTNLQALLSTDGSGWSSTLKGGSALSAGVWYHFALTYDSANVKLYIDGVLDGSESETADIQSNDSALVFGYNGSSGFIDGNICQLGIWKGTSLTQAQIQSIMEKTFEELTASEKTNLVSYWALDVDGSDSHGDNDGTLT